MNWSVLKILSCATMVCASVSLAAESAADVFGSKKFFKTVSGTVEWTSEHWGNGIYRECTNWSADSYDPYDWSDNRSSNEGDGFVIDGNGQMQLLGSGPRFHINSQQSWASTKQFYKNVEWTGYFKRKALGGKDYGGMVVGVRSGALGHGSSGGNNCDANTYYARFRNDGKWDFEKELQHPGSYYRSGSGIGHQDHLWGGTSLPVGRWIGMKYIVYNSSETSVHLELYIDSISGGNPSKAVWKKVGEADDAGNDWSGASGGAATISGCKYSNAYTAILNGGGIILMRTDDDQPYYKYVTIREIDPTAKFTEEEYGDIEYSSSSVTSSSSGSSSKPGSTFTGVGKDDFGFAMKYPTKEGYKVWTSAYWGNGKDYTINYWPRDSLDPTCWADDQSGDGSSVDHFRVFGDGRMQMISNIPRFHINSLDKELADTQKQFFRDMEWTGYFMRNAEGGKDHGGLVVGLRSGPDNHGSSEGNDCQANTYYARFMNSGKWDFEKELKHPGSFVRSGSGIGKQDPLWGGKTLPVGKWIGMKYIVYNKDESTVRLELYIDSTSSATPPGKWELVGMAEDNGKSWSGASNNASIIEGCEAFGLTSAYTAILQGGGTALMRSDNDNPYYKFVTLREIDPSNIPMTHSSSSEEETSSSSIALDASSSSIKNAKSSNSGAEMRVAQGTALPVFTVAVAGRSIHVSADVWQRDAVLLDMQGRILQKVSLQGKSVLQAPSAGIYFVRVNSQLQRIVVR